MNGHDWLAERFEENRGHLRAVAYRMLGSLTEADDAVQEAWLRLSRSDTSGVENVGGWLTTVVARLCLDMLRSRNARREEPLDAQAPKAVSIRTGGANPEAELQLADSVGLALLVVLETLTPAERIAFVLHDMFDLSFDEIGPIVDRSPAAARQLASRARRRVRRTPASPDPSFERQREVVEAFLAASREGDFESLVALLDPDVVVRGDGAARLLGAAVDIHGAEVVARSALRYRARAARAVLVNGAVGVVIAPRGRLMMVLTISVRDGKIAEIEAVADPQRVRQFDLAVLDS